MSIFNKVWFSNGVQQSSGGKKWLTVCFLLAMLGGYGTLIGNIGHASQEQSPDAGLHAVEKNPSYSVFVSAMKKSGLWKTIAAEKTITIFLPDNDALDSEGSRFLLETVLLAKGNEQRLVEVLSQHLVKGKISLIGDDAATGTLTSYDGRCLDFDLVTMRVGLESTVTRTVDHGKAIIHLVDRMISQAWNDERVCTA